jgi:hypothetical protein
LGTKYVILFLISSKSKEEKKISIEYLIQEPKFIKSDYFRDDPSLIENEKLILNDRKMSTNSIQSENEKKESKLKNLFKNEETPNNLNIDNLSGKKDEISKKIIFNYEDFPDLNKKQIIKHANIEEEFSNECLLDTKHIEIFDESSLPCNTKSKTGVKKTKNKKNKNYEELDISILQENKNKEDTLKAKQQASNISAGLKLEKKLMKDNKVFTSSKK